MKPMLKLTPIASGKFPISIFHERRSIFPQKRRHLLLWASHMSEKLFCDPIAAGHQTVKCRVSGLGTRICDDFEF